MIESNSTALRSHVFLGEEHEKSERNFGSTNPLYAATLSHAQQRRVAIEVLREVAPASAGTLRVEAPLHQLISAYASKLPEIGRAFSWGQEIKSEGAMGTEVYRG